MYDGLTSDGISSIAATIVSATGYANSSFVGNLLLEVVIEKIWSCAVRRAASIAISKRGAQHIERGFF